MLYPVTATPCYKIPWFCKLYRILPFTFLVVNRYDDPIPAEMIVILKTNTSLIDQIRIKELMIAWYSKFLFDRDDEIDQMMIRRVTE